MLFKSQRSQYRSAFVTLLALVLALTTLALVAPLALGASDTPINPMAVEGPVAREFSVLAAEQLSAVATVPVDVAAALAEDSIRERNDLPPRFAIGESTWLSPEDSGTWENLDQRHQMWRMRISSPGALSLNLGFTGFELPKGARLSIYPVDVTDVEDYRGVLTFTNADNEDHGQLWTPVILADDVVLELVLPVSERQNYRLELTAINKGYRYFGENLAELGYDKAGTCNIDVVCPEGDDWRAEINSVGVISTGGTTFCTGSMLNNTAGDGTPYFLTANHCGISGSNAASLVVYWNFQSVNCGDQSGGVLNQFLTGSTFLASSAASDFTLVEMNDPVDPAHEVSFAGWDKTSVDPTSATAIHHPATDEKSISFEYDPTSTTTYLGSAVPGDGSHIRVTDWDVGTTEPGSSGSPLFDQNHRVVGQLHGGYAACGNDLSDWYGRLSVSWPQIAQYLDPLSTGQDNIDTYAPWASGLQMSGTNLDATGNAGGPITPTGTVYTVVNSSTTSLNFEVTSDVTWVDVVGGTGTLAGGASAAVTINLNANVNLLGNGLYLGTLTFINLTDGDGGGIKPMRVQIGVPELVHGFSLDTDLGWAMTGDWAFGVPTGSGGTAYGNPDPSAGYTGNNVIGYNLGGDYTNGMAETHMVTTSIDCSNLSATSLRFWRWLNVEQSAYDHASVAVSNDSINFTTVWANGAELAETAWTQVSYDISAVADGQSTVFVRWTMGTTDGSWEYSGWNIDDVEIWGLPSAVSPVGDLPLYKLSVGNYPNPFNPVTKVSFVLERAGHANVRVYDVQGRLIKELIDGLQAAGPGSVVWDGTDLDGQRAASGVYFVQVLSGGQKADHKMVLLK
ncbi:MAG: FlgD immunoglobulin-like domain containing protein [Candidatus Krumholzibacteria bacterium]|nr:FlgD immunoglobulin-like domain containing protein [Candidatus Krumholzibacteria bacterium]